MRQSVQGLWPLTIRHPWRRMALAMLGAPFLLALVLASGVAVLEGLAEGLHGAGGMAADFLWALLLFTLTLGAVGVAVLWATSQRGAAAWAATGGLLGTIFGTAHGVITASQVREIDMMHAALIGIALFLLIRWIAGVRDEAA